MLAYGCRLKLDTVLTVIIATAVVHNICRANNEQEPPYPEDVERFEQVMRDDDVPNIPPPDNYNLRQGNQIRRELIENYFRYMDE